MKRIIYIALLMLIPISITAHTNKKGARKKARVTNVQRASQSSQTSLTKEDGDNKIYEVVEEQASFPGGNTAMVQWLSQNMRYPVTAKKDNIQGRVLVQFVVEKDGSISNVAVVRSIDSPLDKEAVRVVKAMPKWNPGKHKGQIVRSKFTLPINFKL